MTRTLIQQQFPSTEIQSQGTLPFETLMEDFAMTLEAIFSYALYHEEILGLPVAITEKLSIVRACLGLEKREIVDECNEKAKDINIIITSNNKRCGWLFLEKVGTCLKIGARGSSQDVRPLRTILAQHFLEHSKRNHQIDLAGDKSQVVENVLQILIRWSQDLQRLERRLKSGGASPKVFG